MCRAASSFPMRRAPRHRDRARFSSYGLRARRGHPGPSRPCPPFRTCHGPHGRHARHGLDRRRWRLALLPASGPRPRPGRGRQRSAGQRPASKQREERPAPPGRRCVAWAVLAWLWAFPAALASQARPARGDDGDLPCQASTYPALAARWRPAAQRPAAQAKATRYAWRRFYPIRRAPQSGHKRLVFSRLDSAARAV